MFINFNLLTLPNKEEDQEKIRIVILYHPDERGFKVKLREHLSTLTKKSIADIWDEELIIAGENEEKEIQQQIQTAGIVLFLISASSMACKSLDTQLKRVIYRHEQESLPLIPVRVKSFDLKGSDLEKYRILPKNGKPVNDSSWNDADEPFKEISEETKKICEQISQTQKTMLGGNYQLNPEFYELEHSFISSPDSSVMNHPKFDDYADRSNTMAHFKIYKEQLLDIRTRMKNRRYNFCADNIEDINKVIGLLKGIDERIQRQKPTFITKYWREIESLISNANQLKLKIADPKYNDPIYTHVAVGSLIVPFCKRLEEFDKLFDHIADSSILDHMDPINPN